MSETTIAAPRSQPFTVDDLLDTPDDGNRYEVLGGSLVVSPAPAMRHQIAADALCRLLWAIRPPGVKVVSAIAVRIPGGDGPVPDIVVTTADPGDGRNGVPHETVHSVIEVVSPSNAMVDRVYKPQLYSEAGIPCHWRVELDPWRPYEGPLPLVVVRLLTVDGWRTIEAPAGRETVLPLAVGRANEREAHTVGVKIDPAVLIEY
jgi:Uma2 family endonuclease